MIEWRHDATLFVREAPAPSDWTVYQLIEFARFDVREIGLEIVIRLQNSRRRRQAKRKRRNQPIGARPSFPVAVDIGRRNQDEKGI